MYSDRNGKIMMNNTRTTVELLLKELDSYLHRNDYKGAEGYLLQKLKETPPPAVALPLRNELMGLYRKCGQKEEALAAADSALQLVQEQGLEQNLGGATTYLNSATVYKAFGKAEESLALFQRAREIYESTLPRGDRRLAGLYNNMGLTLVDLKRFREANELYRKALAVLRQTHGNEPEQAVTWLNIASAAEAEHGAEKAERAVEEALTQAQRLLDGHPVRDGNYAFVCEKCASVFGYYGWFLYRNELEERARRIYGR